MTIQIRSTDPWLLARLITDLQLEGFSADSDDEYNPFYKSYWMAVFTKLKDTSCSKWCNFPDKPVQRITESNYLEILETILSPESPVRG